MADKPKAGLPPPPGQQSAFAARLQGLLGKVGIGPLADVDPQDLYSQPVAYSRITRTPISQVAGEWRDGRAAEYSPAYNEIRVRQDLLQDPYSDIISHESTHGIFQKAGLGDKASDLAFGYPGVGAQATGAIRSAPGLYPPAKTEGHPEWEQDAERNRWDQMFANEGLAYSVGTQDGTPYVLHVASQIKDPEVAKQLIRLHYNALKSVKPMQFDFKSSKVSK